EATTDAAGFILSAWPPLLFPTHQLGGNAELFAEYLFPAARDIEILEIQLQRIQIELCSEIVQCVHGDQRCLRMARRTPGASRADVVQDGNMLLSLIGDLKGIWDRWHAPATGPG